MTYSNALKHNYKRAERAALGRDAYFDESEASISSRHGGSCVFVVLCFLVAADSPPFLGLLGSVFSTKWGPRVSMPNRSTTEHTLPLGGVVGFVEGFRCVAGEYPHCRGFSIVGYLTKGHLRQMLSDRGY